MNFSVIIPTYNRKVYCIRAVKSVLNQKNVLLECIVVDDCSTDNTLEELQKIQDKRLKIFCTKKNSGGSSLPINQGISIAQYDYIAFLDSDDYWRSDRLFNISKIVNSKLNDFQIFYTSSIIQIKYCLPRIVNANINGDISKIILTKNIIGIASRVVVKKSLLMLVGGFDEKRYMDNDWECWMRICQHSNVYSINFPSVYYLQNPFSISSNSESVIKGRYKLFVDKFDNQYIIENAKVINNQLAKLLITRGNNLSARNLIKNLKFESLDNTILFLLTFINNWLLQNIFSIYSYFVYAKHLVRSLLKK
jgi:glycosyltransferase involved in cell wall biosynthesis